LLEVRGLDLRSDVREVAGGGMARRTFSRCIEVCFSGLRVSSNNTEQLICSAIRGELDALVQEFSDVGKLRLSETGEGRHAAIRPAGVDHGTYELSFVVVKHDGGTKQIGTGIAAGRLGAVAKRAAREIKFLAAFGGNGVGRAAESKKIVRSAHAFLSRQLDACEGRDGN
jgi:hypothetical protein